MALARPLWAAALLLLLAGLAQGEVVIEQAARKVGAFLLIAPASEPIVKGPSPLLPCIPCFQIDISSSTAREQERLVLRNDGAEAKASVVLCERSSLLDQAALLEVRRCVHCAGAARAQQGTPATAAGCRRLVLLGTLAKTERKSL